MEQGDIDAVAAIEHRDPSAWSSHLIEAELDLDHSVCLVCCTDDCVVGWCCARVVGDEAELLKVGVDGSHRRRSLGTSLMSVLEDMLRRSNVRTLLLEVRSQNESALGFYRRLGFTPAGKRIRYYSQPDDDALLLYKRV